MGRSGRVLFGLRIALLALIAGTLIFIFTNSALPPKESAEQSGAVGDFISLIIPPDTELGAYIQTNLRKIAHFTEYGMLGVELAVYFLAFDRRRRHILCSAAVPFAVGFVDETIQIFSGRGPSVSDVWIDVGGFFTFSLLAYAVGVCASVITRAAAKRRAESQG